MITRIENEISQLHKFFVDWYNGILPFSTEAFQRCEEALAPGFTMVPPDNGKIVERSPLVGALWNLHAEKIGLEIWIKNVQIQHKRRDVILVTYEEWQKYNNEVTARLSSALFEEASTFPNGVRWLHVHETWMD